jgi:tripartite-type tricarboxylate transporter receptor subunit TctC
MKNAILRLVAACLATTTLFASPAHAQSYANRPVTMVVPFPAGSATDTVARLIGRQMAAKLGQPIVMENVAGAAGTIAAAKVARAPADGFTILIHTTIALSAVLHKNLSYDTATAFETIGMVNSGPYVLASNLAYKASDANDLLRSLKADSTKVAFANAGVGTGSHLCAIGLSQALGVPLNLIPYKSSNLALQDVIAGHADILWDQTTNALPHYTSNKIKVYAITSQSRHPKLPGIPTTRELGLPQIDMTVWHGLYAPKGTPAAIVTQLNEALQVALADPDVQKRLDAMGTDLFPPEQRTPAAHARQLAQELVRFRELVKSANIEVN